MGSVCVRIKPVKAKACNITAQASNSPISRNSEIRIDSRSNSRDIFVERASMISDSSCHSMGLSPAYSSTCNTIHPTSIHSYQTSTSLEDLKSAAVDGIIAHDKQRRWCLPRTHSPIGYFNNNSNVNLMRQETKIGHRVPTSNANLCVPRDSIERQIICGTQPVYDCDIPIPKSRVRSRQKTYELLPVNKRVDLAIPMPVKTTKPVDSDRDACSLTTVSEMSKNVHNSLFNASQTSAPLKTTVIKPNKLRPAASGQKGVTRSTTPVQKSKATRNRSSPVQETKVTNFGNTSMVSLFRYRFLIDDNEKNRQRFSNRNDRRVESIARTSQCSVRATKCTRRHVDGCIKQQITVTAPSLHCLKQCCRMFDDTFPSFNATSGLTLPSHPSLKIDHFGDAS